MSGKRVFISYCSQETDVELAKEIYEHLQSAGHEPFMAMKSIRLGDNWSQCIDQALEQCDYFLLLLSPEAAISDMVIEEVRRAKELFDSRGVGRPSILPIRVNLSIAYPLRYELRGYLNRLQQREWNSADDTVQVVQEILSILNKKNILRAGLVHSASDSQPFTDNFQSFGAPVAPLELPGGQVDLASPYYVERSPQEAECYRTILQPGALIRIKAPRQMGKTSLLSRILRHGEDNQCLTVPLSFQLADESVFLDLDKFLQWFCLSVGRRLGLSNQLVDFWDDIFGSKANCTIYFEEYLLPSISAPVVLGLDEVDMVLGHPSVASDFFGLLRAWHERGKTTVLWKKLRLVIAHSTETYIPMNINQSPYNVGLSIELLEFTVEQVIDLALRHGLCWNSKKVTKLMAMVGGHPYLIRVALYQIAQREITLDELLHVAPTDDGPYGDYLRRLSWSLEQQVELTNATTLVMTSSQPVRLESVQAFQLDSMGLIHFQGNGVVPRCRLYERYFSSRFS